MAATPIPTIVRNVFPKSKCRERTESAVERPMAICRAGAPWFSRTVPVRESPRSRGSFRMKAVSDCHTCRAASCLKLGDGSGARDHVAQPLLRLPATSRVAERIGRVSNESRSYNQLAGTAENPSLFASWYAIPLRRMIRCRIGGCETNTSARNPSFSASADGAGSTIQR
jgi:hypothetical protein